MILDQACRLPLLAPVDTVQLVPEITVANGRSEIPPRFRAKARRLSPENTVFDGRP